MSIQATQQRLRERTLMVRDGKIAPMRDFGDNIPVDRFVSGLRYGNYDPHTLAMTYATGTIATACTDFRSTVVSQIPLQVLGADGKVIEGGLPISQFINRSSRFLYQIEASLNIWGKAYLLKHRNIWGYSNRVQFIRPTDVQEIPDPIHDTVDGYLLTKFGRIIKPAEMIAIRNFSSLSDIEPLSAFEKSMKRIRTEAALIEYASSFFFNSARLDGMLTFSGKITADEKKEAKELWEKAFKGVKNAWKTFVHGVSGGGEWRWTSFSAPPVDLAMPELNNIAKADICAFFQTNPILIGIGMASDPLSATGTFDAAFNQHIQHVTTPEIKFICQELTEQWLEPDFKINLKIAPDLSDVEGATLATEDRSTTAQNNVKVNIFTVNEARKYVGKPQLENHIDRDPTYALAVYDKGLIKRSQAQLAIGVDPDEANDGYIWEVDPRTKPIAAASPFTLNMPPSPPTLPPPSPEPPVEITRADPTPAYVSLDLSDHPVLMDIRGGLKRRPEFAEARDWTADDQFHITLAYGEDVQGDTLARVIGMLPRSLPAMAIRVREVSLFDHHDDGTVVHLAVEPSAELVALQRQVFDALTRLGVKTSEFSAPDAYTPHITLCYLPAGRDLPSVEFHPPITLTPRAVQISRDDYQTIHTIPLEAQPAQIPERSAALVAAQLRELELWRDKVKRKGEAVEFATEHLTSDIAEYVRGELTEMWNPSVVFDAAKTWVRDGTPAKPIGATPQDAEEYWKGFDALTVDLGTDWLTQQAVPDTLIDHIASDPDAGIAAWEGTRESAIESLTTSWVGDLETPGPLLQLILAGVSAGDKALERETTAKPNSTRAKQIRDLTVGVSWDIIATEALKFARQYAGVLIKGLDATTVQMIRDAVARQVEQGWTQEQLREALINIFVQQGVPPSEQIINRARLIADTESTKTFNSGAFERWKNVGVSDAVWVTVRDKHVCRICRRLHGQRAKISDGWVLDGVTYRDSAHPRCRCPRRPVVE